MADTKIVSLYNGQVDVKFYRKKHQYYRKVNIRDKSWNTPTEEIGQWIKIPSTTFFTKGIFDKPELYDWFSKTAIDGFVDAMNDGCTIDQCRDRAKKARYAKLSAAGDTGSIIHGWINQYCMAEQPDLLEDNIEVSNALEGFLEWFDENVVEVLETECIVYNPLLDIAGTLDLLYLSKKGEKVLVDFKSGNNIYPADVMQIAFYRHTYSMMSDEVSHADIVHLRKDEPKAIPLRTLDNEANYNAFEASVYLMKWKDTLKVGQ